ncbi:MAG: hypothetical protein PVSMB2_37340 [Ktedonobacteraceae bacterium]
MANKEQKKTQKVAPKSNKQKKEAAKEKKAAKETGGGIPLEKEWYCFCTKSFLARSRQDTFCAETLYGYYLQKLDTLVTMRVRYNTLY